MSSSLKGINSNILAIETVGMVSSIGLDAHSTCAAMRAGISKFEEIPFHDQNGEPIIGAPALEAVPDRQGYNRLAPLLLKSINECIMAHNGNLNNTKGTIPVMITLDASDRPDYPTDLSERLSMALKENLSRDFSQNISIYLEGKTGFFQSLLRARELLKNEDVEGCIIAGADSLLNARALLWLENNDRLKTNKNSDGIIPGEAAAAIWLSKPHKQKESMLYIAGIGIGSEHSVLEKNRPNMAIGLAEAIRNSLEDAKIPLHEIDFRVAGVCGERLEFMEASTAIARIQRVHKDNFELIVPAEHLGDVGAALPACMVVSTAQAFIKGYSPGKKAILFSSSRSSERAAAVAVSVNGGGNG